MSIEAELRMWARGAAIITGALLVVALARATWESHRYARLGDEAVAGDDWESAALHYRHAAQWYVPLVGAQGRSFDALVALGDQRRAADDIEGALLCYRSARTASMATRSFWTPAADKLPALHAKIGALMAAQIGGGDAEAAAFAAQLDAWRTRAPNPVLAVGASLAFMAWIVSLFGLAVRGFAPDGTLVPRTFGRLATASAALLALWVTLVRFA